MRYKLVSAFKALVVSCFLCATFCLWHIHSRWNRTAPPSDSLFGTEAIISAYNASFDNKPTANIQRGISRAVIHIDEWKADDFCLSTLQDVYWHPLFPKYPSKHGLVQSLDHITKGSKDAAIRRILFLICPPAPGRYQFFIAVEGGFDLFVTEWDYKGDYNRDALYHFYFDNVASRKKETVTSEWIDLEANKVYMIDLIHWIKSSGSITLSWRTPMSNFGITSFDLICFPSHTNMPLDATHMLPEAPFTSERQKSLRNPQLTFYLREPRTLRDFNASLRACSYNPSYLVKGKVAKFTGWHRAWEGKFYPYYPVFRQAEKPVRLEKREASQIASEVFYALYQGSGCSRCKMDRVVFVEQNRETKRGHRYFVEIDVTDTDTNQTIRVSDHVYKPGNSSPICLPNGHIWSRDVDVNVVFTTSSSNRKWTLLLLDSISKILYATGDRNVRVWIAAFGLKNVDLDHELTKRNLQGTVLRMSGKFNKVRALNAIVRTIRDPDSLVFTLDLHLELPFHIFDQARKNTILGKTVFAPVLVRLECGKHPEYTDAGSSHWVFDGFGIIGVYKNDWDIIGGMNETLFGQTWGGEDWELMDRVISKGYEVIRRRLTGFYHIYHARTGSEWYNVD